VASPWSFELRAACIFTCAHEEQLIPTPSAHIFRTVPSCCPCRPATMGPGRAGSAAAAQVGATTTPVTRCVLPVTVCMLRERNARTLSEIDTETDMKISTGAEDKRTHSPRSHTQTSTGTDNVHSSFVALKHAKTCFHALLPEDFITKS
jgi:hypothetical protein